MLTVKTPEEVFRLIEKEFAPLQDRVERVPLNRAVGRVLGEEILAKEYVPDFNRSTVDGYAVRSSDTFGCSDSIPSVIPIYKQVLMGEEADFTLPEGMCCAIPTGGAVPEGADSCVMIEYTEDYGDGTIGISRSAAPGQNMIFRGDDVTPGKKVLNRGRLLTSQDVGALAALGIVQVPVVKGPKVGIISTGDELVPPSEQPKPGQVRDVNSYLLSAMLTAFGAESVLYGITADNEKELAGTVRKALDECDLVLISGGSSVGVKDATCRIIESMGTIYLHGIAMKPGKPTILGKCGGKPVVGLPGHPVAAYFVAKVFVLEILGRLMGRDMSKYTVTATLTESVGANHGRAQYGGVRIYKEGETYMAQPVRSKSGLITTLAGTDGYFRIDRDCEGLPKGAQVQVTICEGN